MSVVWADLRVGTSYGSVRPTMEQEGGIMGVFGEVTVKQSKNGISGLRVEEGLLAGSPLHPRRQEGVGPEQRLGQQVHEYHFSFLVHSLEMKS